MMILRLCKRFAVHGNFIRVGNREVILVPRVHAVIRCAKLFAVHQIGRYTFIFLGPRVLTIRHCE